MSTETEQRSPVLSEGEDNPSTATGKEGKLKVPVKKRIVSGVQPTGNLHVGNYLGAIKQWVDNQVRCFTLIYVKASSVVSGEVHTVLKSL